jgi:hypothetical protein
MNERQTQQGKSAGISIPNRDSSGLLQRKCTACGQHTIAGGICGSCEQRQGMMQRKLMIGASNDPQEVEADRVADQVMAGPEHPPVGGAPVRIQRFTEQGSGQMDRAPASVERVIASSGRPLEPAIQQDMEQRFGQDFSRVRVYLDAQAQQSARDVNAHAYTVGNAIVFGSDRYAPETNHGRRLIAHELTHVLQQKCAGSHDGGPNVVRQVSNYTLQREDAAPAKAATMASNTPRERLIRAIDRLDAIDLGNIPRALSSADRNALLADKGLRKYIVDKLRLWPGLKLLVDLQYGPNLPTDVRALVDAAAARDAAGVISAVQGSARLRNQGLDPSVVATLIQVFAGDPRHDAVVAVVRMAATPSLEVYLEFARKSSKLRELEERATRALQRSTGDKNRTLEVSIDAVGGRTETQAGETQAQGSISIESNLTIQAFAGRYAHELANVTILRELNDIKPGNFPDGYAYADAVIEIETSSMVARAVVAAELGIPFPLPTEDLAKIKSGQMSSKQIYEKLYAERAKFFTVIDGIKVPARDFYKNKWEANRRLAH